MDLKLTEHVTGWNYDIWNSIFLAKKKSILVYISLFPIKKKKAQEDEC